MVVINLGTTNHEFTLNVTFKLIKFILFLINAKDLVRSETETVQKYLFNNAINVSKSIMRYQLFNLGYIRRNTAVK